MNQEEKQQVLGYIEKFSGVFNSMMMEVTKRLAEQGAEPNKNPFQYDGYDGNEQASSVKVDPKKFVKQQMDFLEKQQRLWESASKAFMGEPVEPVITAGDGDKRFDDGDWHGNPGFSYIKQAYLLNAEYMHQLVDVLEFEDKKVAGQVKFYTRQFINSVAPTNYVLTNPEVCRELLSTQGENLAKGIDNFMRDLENSPAEAFKITQVDSSAFALGENLANTPGKVVFENELIQLIQYTPTSAKVKQVPLLIVPPFINKYYILDLDEKKSMVRWMVEQGYTVFIISWVNPDESLSTLSFDGYVSKGVVASLDAVENITKSSSINAAGYCVGGTLLGVSQAYLSAIGDKRIKSLTLFTTLFDFSEPGEVGNYISHHIVPLVEQSIGKKGYFDGRILALSFSLLRENNMFWSYFIDNYLKGKDPTPFDILYWNSDSTNIPADAFLYYLKNMYLGNKLIEKGGITILGHKIDLDDIKVPCYCLAAQADHIVLWPSAYASARQLNTDVRFVMTESGHVAGVVNPAARGKYPHWVNEAMPGTHQEWLEGAHQVEGSWWNDWNSWLAERSGNEKVAVKKAGSKHYAIIEDAPGAYVKRRLSES
ncbi:MAG: polyhydroxyalkanoate synthase [Lentisphaeria bacterium]|jgi:polyhydroxyalkanoate synthase